MKHFWGMIKKRKYCGKRMLVAKRLLSQVVKSRGLFSLRSSKYIKCSVKHKLTGTLQKFQ